MYGVKVSLGIRGMAVDAARQRAKDRKESRALVHMKLNEFHGSNFAWPYIVLDGPPGLWCLSPGEGWDAVT